LEGGGSEYYKEKQMELDHYLTIKVIFLY
jgi:hypothetical protein